MGIFFYFLETLLILVKQLAVSLWVSIRTTQIQVKHYIFLLLIFTVWLKQLQFWNWWIIPQFPLCQDQQWKNPWPLGQGQGNQCQTFLIKLESPLVWFSNRKNSLDILGTNVQPFLAIQISNQYLSSKCFITMYHKNVSSKCFNKMSHQNVSSKYPSKIYQQYV